MLSISPFVAEMLADLWRMPLVDCVFNTKTCIYKIPLIVLARLLSPIVMVEWFICFWAGTLADSTTCRFGPCVSPRQPFFPVVVCDHMWRRLDTRKTGTASDDALRHWQTLGQAWCVCMQNISSASWFCIELGRRTKHPHFCYRLNPLPCD